MKLDDKNFQIVVGTIADPLVSQMKLLIKNKLLYNLNYIPYIT